jgi:hypothetical protein
MKRNDTEKFLETVGGLRCPCGHLEQRHRKPEGVIAGEKMGACRDCECRGLIDCWSDEEEAA